MSLYAPFLERYFTRQYVRGLCPKQRERIFKKANWVDVDLSEVRIEVAPDGRSAMTRFRKTTISWECRERARGPSCRNFAGDAGNR